ncbi:MAG TPA: pilus assembly protein TadG-related protein [Anaerolineales bacterium]|nr:pilus assembly protein TadG-related protein [Anaerolineales bacterium]
MKKLFPSTKHGQALILMALAAFGLFAITGLAIDGSAKFSDRRHAQNAADTAAVAGALALARNDPSLPPWNIIAKNRARDNGYDNNLVSNIVTVNNPPATGYYSNCLDTIHFNCNDYVQVIIDSNVNTYFARVIGINQTHNHVEAVASIVREQNLGTSVFGGNAVVALRPDGCALMAQGTSNVTINGGGLYSNSDDPSCSFQAASCASYLDVNDKDGNQGAVTMVGGYNAHLGCMPQADLIPSAQQQLPFPPPYQEITPPAVCSQTADLNSNYSVTGSGSNKTATLQSGHYSKIPLNGQWKNIILNPGVYCIDSTLNSPDSLIVSGTPGLTAGVFIYFKPGGSFTFNGGSDVQLWGINDANVAIDPSLAIYKGFLLYVAPNYASGTPPNCLLNGNATDTFTGTIYAPYCNMTIDGTSDPSGFQTQIVAYTVKFAGGANVILVYDQNSSPLTSLIIPLQVGLSK